jgi:hypothetical protein
MSGLRRSVFVLSTALAVLLWSASSVMAGGSDWKVGYITGSGKTLSFSSANVPATGLASFNFTDQPNTSLLVTDHGALKGVALGDLTGKTIHADFDITGVTGTFFYDTTNNPCGTPANVRLYFQTDGSGGFAFTHFWWSNPDAQILVNGEHGVLNATVEPAEWSDWNGMSGVVEAAGFANAASNVTLIGLSFGGGCFFENGVGTTDGSGTFTLDSFSVS